MKFTLQHYNLPLRHPFKLGNGTSRTATPVTIVTCTYKGFVAFGEAAMPPYLGESHQSAEAFINQLDFSKVSFPFNLDAIHGQMDGLASGNASAKAAIDIALHDLWGKIEGKPVKALLGQKNLEIAPTTFTLGIAPGDEIRKKTEEGLDAGFKQFKAKLGGDNDREIIAAIRSVTSLPLFVDVNQGWKIKEAALDMVYELKENRVLFVEQPFAKTNYRDQEWLVERSPLPVFADEACQRLSDINTAKELYHGINVKLMKSTGIHEALKMVNLAREKGLKTMLGCMTETSCATLAAVSVAPLFDYIDLDGPWMLAKQPFKQPLFSEGKLYTSDEPGLGLQPVSGISSLR